MSVIEAVIYCIGVLLLVGLQTIRVGGNTVPRVRRSRDAIEHTDQHSELASLQRLLSLLVVVLITTIGIVRFGWPLGIILTIFVCLCAGAVGRMPIVHRIFQSLYVKLEEYAVWFVASIHPVLHFLRYRSDPVVEFSLSSREEFEQLIEHSEGLFSTHEKKRLLGSLDFVTRTVQEIMTPRRMIDSVSAGELLGPLALDELHKTGHSRFPVVRGDIDHIVGMLYIHDLLLVDSGKHSTTVDKAMEPRVFYIHEKDTLDRALSGFLRTRHHLFVVVNEFKETVGLLSLEDVIEALIGQAIVDEDDVYDDLRVVASRHAADDHAAGGVDV